MLDFHSHRARISEYVVKVAADVDSDVKVVFNWSLFTPPKKELLLTEFDLCQCNIHV